MTREAQQLAGRLDLLPRAAKALVRRADASDQHGRDRQEEQAVRDDGRRQRAAEHQGLDRPVGEQRRAGHRQARADPAGGGHQDRNQVDGKQVKVGSGQQVQEHEREVETQGGARPPRQPECWRPVLWLLRHRAARTRESPPCTQPSDTPFRQKLNVRIAAPLPPRDLPSPAGAKRSSDAC